MSFPERYPKIVEVTDENGDIDNTEIDLFGPVYFDQNENMYISDYQSRFIDMKMEIVEVLMPPKVWLSRQNDKIDKLREFTDNNHYLRKIVS